MSQEFEDDGEIRIFTNGRHPEIAKYIEWFENNDNTEIDRYRADLMSVVWNYRESLGEDVYYGNTDMLFPNRAVMDEVIKKEADPDYVMDHDIMRAVLPSTYEDK